MAHVAEYKKKVVKEFSDLIRSYPIVGAINMENMPAPQLQQMRKQLQGKVEIKMTKRRLMKLAIDAVKEDKKGIEELEKYFIGMPALLFTKENPFTLFKIIKKSKSKAPAKPGQTAPHDIEVKAGPTPFAPGPIISELGALGLKTVVEDGKVAIKEDAIIVKEGEEINENTASMLLRLGIEPMEIGLDVVAVFEDGTIFDKEVLDIDEEQFLADLVKADRWAFNLAVDAGIPNKRTVEFMIAKAYNDSKALALDQDILTDETAGIVLGKAEAQANSLKAAANIPDAPKEEAKPEEKKEDKEKPKEEVKAEEPAKAEPAKEEAPKEEVKEEEPKAEEASVEEKKEEAEAPKEEVKEEKAEEKAEEPVKEEEAPKEEPKEEKAEEKADEPVKEEEAPKEEPKEEQKKEETPKEEPAKEKAPEEPVEETPKEEPAKEEAGYAKKEKPEESPVKEEKPAEEAPKEEAKEGDDKSTEDKVKEMVQKTQNYASNKTPSAGDLLK